MIDLLLKGFDSFIVQLPILLDNDVCQNKNDDKQSIAEKVASRVVKRLREERLAQGMSKNRLATLAHVDPKTVAFVEDEKRNPTLYTLLKLATALDIELGAIISEVEE